MSNERQAPSAPFSAARSSRPLLIVLSAPSGGGKTTLCRAWLDMARGLTYSVSCTTRPPRPGETEGTSYRFLSDAAFARRVAAGDFLEQAEVHGNRYGTLKETVADALRRGMDIVMAIDVQGAASLRAQALAPDGDPLIRNGFVDIFIAPPSEAVLRERLLGRGTDSPERIALRLRNAVDEMARWTEYRYCVVNDDLAEAVRQLEAIRVAEHCRVPAGQAAKPHGGG